MGWGGASWSFPIPAFLWRPGPAALRQCPEAAELPDPLCAPRASAWLRGRKERASEGPGCSFPPAVWRLLWGCVGWMFLLPFQNLPWGTRPGGWLDAGGGIRDCGLLEILRCHPLAAPPSSSSCWRWIPFHEQLDDGGGSAWDCHQPCGARAGLCCVPPGAGAGTGSEMCGYRRWHGVGRAVTVPMLLGG